MHYLRLIPVLTSLLCFAQVSAQSKDKEKKLGDNFVASNIQDIFHNLDSDFCGMFGNEKPESEFRIKFTQFNAAMFQPNIDLELNGFNWHQFQVISFIGYLRIFRLFNQDTAAKAYFKKDSNISHHLLLDSLNRAGWFLHQAEGGFDFMEDSSRPFSGRFQGLFNVYFFYNKKLGLVSKKSPVFSKTTPAIQFSGVWSPLGDNTVYTPVYWSNFNPDMDKSGKNLVPDLRINFAGKIGNNGSIAIPESAAKAPKNWWIQNK